jgi:hypothetical protein
MSPSQLGKVAGLVATAPLKNPTSKRKKKKAVRQIKLMERAALFKKCANDIWGI